MSFQTMETAEEANESNIEEKEINQGYKIWKKNTPLLYGTSKHSQLKFK